MAYLIFADRKGELARHELAGPITLGRSPDCSIAVHDALLSRRHCKIEPVLDQWVITDLESKNGTILDGRKVTRQTLQDGDVVRMGRTQVCFRAGAFVPAPSATRPADFRPLDPIEALAGTVAGFRLEPEPIVDTSTFPRPQPRPAEPRSLSREEAHSLVVGLSSSSWDSLTMRDATARPAARRPRPMVAIREAARQQSRWHEKPVPHIGRLIAIACAAVTVVIAMVIFARHI